MNMPFINVKTSAKLSDEQIGQIVKDMGQAITAFPGKTEAYLMVNVEPDCKLYFKGNNDGKTAFVDVAIFGNSSKEYCGLFTEKVCDVLEKTAGVPSDRCYVKFEFNTMWGYDRFMF